MVTRTVIIITFGYLPNSGGWDDNHNSNIDEYDPETKEWTRIGTMMDTREGPGVAVVDYDDYKEFCQ